MIFLAVLLIVASLLLWRLKSKLGSNLPTRPIAKGHVER